MDNRLFSDLLSTTNHRTRLRNQFIHTVGVASRDAASPEDRREVQWLLSLMAAFPLQCGHPGAPAHSRDRHRSCDCPQLSEVPSLWCYSVLFRSRWPPVVSTQPPAHHLYITTLQNHQSSSVGGTAGVGLEVWGVQFRSGGCVYCSFSVWTSRVQQDREGKSGGAARGRTLPRCNSNTFVMNISAAWEKKILMI